MKHITPIIVGAGGVASYLLAPLNKTFEIKGGMLIDKDIFEPHNLDRQLFPKTALGKAKAEALVRYNKIKLLPALTYLDETLIDSIVPSIRDCENLMVIALVDNHPARRAAIGLAQALHCPIIIGANEYETSQAIYYDTEWPEKYDPRIRYPDMMTDDSGSPVGCVEEQSQGSPQLAMANMVTAALVLNLLWKWIGDECYDTDLPQGYQPIELQTTLGIMETITYEDIK